MPTSNLFQLFEVLKLKQKFLAVLFIFSLKYAGLLPVCLIFPCILKHCVIVLVGGESLIIAMVLQIAGGLICAAPWTRQKRLEAPLQKRTTL